MPPNTSRPCPKRSMMRRTDKSPGRREQWAGNAFANSGAAGLEQKRIAVSGRWRSQEIVRDATGRPAYTGTRLARCPIALWWWRALGPSCVALLGTPAFLFAPFAVPDGALFQTSPYLRATSWAWWASWWFGLQPVTPSELQTKRQVQMQPRIQGKRVRYDDRPVSAPSVHSFQAPGWLEHGT